MSTLYLIRGLPGSGKSKLAQSMHWMNGVAAVIEADHYFMKTGEYIFDASKLHKAHQACQERAEMYLSEGQSVIVSNTSTTEKEVDTYRKIAYDCDAEFVSIIVENRHEGKNVHGVPDDKLQQMRNRFSIKL